MRIIHTSDWHLGRTLEGRSRIQEQREFINELCAIVDRENVHLVLIAGDVFDTYNPSAEAEELFYQAVERLAAGGKRAVVAVAGNHDSPDRLHAANPLAKRHGIFLLGYPGEDLFSCSSHPAAGEAAAAVSPGAGEPVQTVNLASGGPGWLEISIPECSEHAVLVMLPYPSEQRLNETLVATLGESEMQQAYSQRVATAFQQGAAYFRDDTVNLAVSHIFLLGGLNSESEREIQLGGAYIVEPAALPQNAHYVALGHLHRPQKIGGTVVPGRYSGSPLCYSFSEAEQQKEVVLVEARPGQDAGITPIKLYCGKPMRFLRFADYDEALEWSRDAANQRLWVDMEIASPQPLDSAQISALRKLHAGIINIRIILPGVNSSAENPERLSELTMEERFNRFVVRETGAAAPRELYDLFMELLLGGEAVETDEA